MGALIIQINHFINDWLEEREMTHLKKHQTNTIRPGDGLRASTGHIVHVLEAQQNEDGTKIVVANKKISQKKLKEIFSVIDI
jgi:hypothetical protein